MRNSRSFKLAGVVMVCLLATACSTTEQRKALYEGAEAERPLELPPALKLQESRDALHIPEALPAAKKQSADVVTPVVPIAVTTTVLPTLGLPDSDKVRLERDGSMQWLVVQGEPNAVWPVVEAYWGQYGPSIKRSSPEFMTMETEWASLGDGEESTIFRRVFGALFAENSREQFRVRLEPGVEAGTTELYLSHQRMVRQSVDESLRWLPGASDAELESKMLKRLLVFMGMDEAQAQTLLFNGADAQYSFVKNPAGEPYISIQAPQAWAWRRVAQALSRAGTIVIASDDVARTYDIRYTQVTRNSSGGGDGLLSFQDKGVSTEDLLLRAELVIEAGETRLYIRERNGDATVRDQAEHVLKIVLEKFN